MSILSQATPEPAAPPERSGSMEERLSFQSRFVLVFGEIDDKLALATCRRLLALSERIRRADHAAGVLARRACGVGRRDPRHDPLRARAGHHGGHRLGGQRRLRTSSWRRRRNARVCLPNTRFMIHQPAGGAGGQATDIAIQAKEILRTRERIARVIATPDRQVVRHRAGRHGARLLDERRGGRQVRHRLARHRAPEGPGLRSPDVAPSLLLPVGQQLQGGIRVARDGAALRKRVRRLHERANA